MKINQELYYGLFKLLIIVLTLLPRVDSDKNNKKSSNFNKNDLEYYKYIKISFVRVVFFFLNINFKFRNRVEKMFYHAYDNYIYNAYPYDELQPISCKGFDTWGSYSLTLIDSLDMLIILK